MRTIRIRKIRKADLTSIERFRYGELSFNKGHRYILRRKLKDRYRLEYLYRDRLRFVRMGMVIGVKTL